MMLLVGGVLPQISCMSLASFRLATRLMVGWPVMARPRKPVDPHRRTKAKRASAGDGGSKKEEAPKATSGKATRAKPPETKPAPGKMEREFSAGGVVVRKVADQSESGPWEIAVIEPRREDTGDSGKTVLAL